MGPDLSSCGEAQLPTAMSLAGQRTFGDERKKSVRWAWHAGTEFFRLIDIRRRRRLGEGFLLRAGMLFAVDIDVGLMRRATEHD